MAIDERAVKRVGWAGLGGRLASASGLRMRSGCSGGGFEGRSGQGLEGSPLAGRRSKRNYWRERSDDADSADRARVGA